MNANEKINMELFGEYEVSDQMNQNVNENVDYDPYENNYEYFYNINENEIDYKMNENSSESGSTREEIENEVDDCDISTSEESNDENEIDCTYELNYHFKHDIGEMNRIKEIFVDIFKETRIRSNNQNN